jgi:hypothetical protein
MTYAQFKTEWNGRRVDYDHVYAYQCVDLILQYCKERFGLSKGIWGNAIDYWYKPSAPLLTKFTRLATKDCKQGDIVILTGLAGNPYGHIGICEKQDSKNVWLLEQNGYGGGTGTGKNAIGVWRAVSKSRIVGVLRPKVAAAPTAGGTAKALREAYVRKAPSTTARLGGSMMLQPGETFKFAAKVAGERVSQNGVNTNIWLKSIYGNYVWSGNCKVL